MDRDELGWDELPQAWKPIPNPAMPNQAPPWPSREQYSHFRYGLCLFLWGTT